MILTAQCSYAQSRTILVLGDSLSAAYGIPTEQGWVPLLQAELKQLYPCYQIVNASQSGMTTQQGISQLAKALESTNPEITILELGANDGLRGQSPANMKQNLQAMISKLKARGSKILLVGIYLPPNYGKIYIDRFQNVYTEIAKEYELQFLPFMLEGIVGNPQLFQADQLHPTSDAQPIIQLNIFTALKPILEQC